MKFIAASLVALAIIAGTLATASAAPFYDSTFERLDMDQRGGHGGG